MSNTELKISDFGLAKMSKEHANGRAPMSRNFCFALKKPSLQLDNVESCRRVRTSGVWRDVHIGRFR